MARQKITIEDMVTGQQEVLECEGLLVCAFNDPVDMGDGHDAYNRAHIEAVRISTIDVMGLMMKKDNPLARAWRAMNKLRWKPRTMRLLKMAYGEE